MELHPRHIRAGRALVGATQQDLADAAKLSLATLNNIEREVAKPRAKTMDRIRQALADGGVKIIADNNREIVEMNRSEELAPDKDFPLRTQVLRLLGKNSLLKVIQCTMFSIEGEFHRLGFCLHGQYRHLWFTSPGIDMRNRLGLADLAAIAIGAFKEIGHELHYLTEAVNESQLHLEAEQLLASHQKQDDLEVFLQLFPESHSIISAASTSEQHPLYHVLRIFRNQKQ